MKKIRIGQIGIGHNHGEAKMQAVRKFPELFEVIGYAEENERWIEKRGGNAKVVYATTNYHVFRGGVWANLAGLPAEGVGSRTKWWYWPNAFMRECAGLMLNRIPQELLLLATMLVFFGTLSLALG